MKDPEYAITFRQAVYDSGLAPCFTDHGALQGPLESKLEVEDTASSYAVCAPAQVEWNNTRDPTKGFKYLFLSDADYTSIAARADTAVLKAEPFFAENGAPLPDTLERSPLIAPEGMWRAQHTGCGLSGLCLHEKFGHCERCFCSCSCMQSSCIKWADLLHALARRRTAVEDHGRGWG